MGEVESCERVPQAVRREVALWPESGPHKPVEHSSTEVVRVQQATVSARENRRVVTEEIRAPCLQLGAQSARKFDRTPSACLRLSDVLAIGITSADASHSVLEVNVDPAQSKRFAKTCSGVREEENEPVVVWGISSSQGK
ncbi:MAG TPA: hypothetical protein VKM54_01920 [Myxococcota bacterium]|nr:hypothetical protein [Myxococcota bacterium]